MRFPAAGHLGACLLGLTLGWAGCAPAPTGDEPIGQISWGLSVGESADSVSCDTSQVAGLSAQLVEEVNCIAPGSLVSFEGPGIELAGNQVLAVLEPPAAAALREAALAQGGSISINSAFRTIAQQYLLYRWMGSCGIQVAAQPGRSNHESGLALDVGNFADWRTALEARGWRWYGDGDRVHYDFIAGGKDLRGNSVLAFQRLWNKNHPEDPIDEDGAYGPMTEARLDASPAEGFATHGCAPPPPPPPDGGPMTPDLPPPDGGDVDGPPPPPTPDAGPPIEAGPGDAGSGPDGAGDDAGPPGQDPSDGLAGGCQVGAGEPGLAASALLLLALLGRRRRR